MAGKPSTKLFYKIGEVCRLTDTKPHILRYWESEFPALAPRKNRGGQRVYEQKDLEMVRSIKRMLYEEGYTISGARKLLSGQGTHKINKAAAERSSGENESGQSPVHEKRETAADKEKDDALADALGRFKREIQELLEIIGR